MKFLLLPGEVSQAKTSMYQWQSKLILVHLEKGWCTIAGYLYGTTQTDVVNKNKLFWIGMSLI
jgi:hypothetical protein